VQDCQLPKKCERNGQQRQYDVAQVHPEDLFEFVLHWRVAKYQIVECRYECLNELFERRKRKKVEVAICTILKTKNREN
jgi:hypothetical protein